MKLHNPFTVADNMTMTNAFWLLVIVTGLFSFVLYKLAIPLLPLILATGILLSVYRVLYAILKGK